MYWNPTGPVHRASLCRGSASRNLSLRGALLPGPLTIKICQSTRVTAFPKSRTQLTLGSHKGKSGGGKERKKLGKGTPKSPAGSAPYENPTLGLLFTSPFSLALFRRAEAKGSETQSTRPMAEDPVQPCRSMAQCGTWHMSEGQQDSFPSHPARSVPPIKPKEASRLRSLQLFPRGLSRVLPSKMT